MPLNAFFVAICVHRNLPTNAHGHKKIRSKRKSDGYKGDAQFAPANS